MRYLVATLSVEVGERDSGEDLLGDGPSLGSQTKGIKENSDGSYDIYFGPKAPKGEESNWLETIPGRSWFTILRMYGATEPWINKTWRPGEIELDK